MIADRESPDVLSPAGDDYPWRRWLDAHANRELGVGAPRGGWRHPPSRYAMDALLEALGRPQDRYRRVIVAGTNGKTTVTRATSALVQATGLRVGTYTSPHLDRLNDRVVVNGAAISDQALARALTRIRAAETTMNLALSWFEIMTAAAMMWFAWEQIDLAVIEVGLGGVHDATAAAMPALVALTNIELDHTEFFGSSRLEVAAAEATVVSAGHGLVLGETDTVLRGCFTRHDPQPLWVRGIDFGVLERRATPDGQVLTLKTPTGVYRDVPVALKGSAHADNYGLALMTAECAAGPLPESVVRQVLPAIGSPGRAEQVSAEPLVLVDGAHNPAGARSLAALLAESFPVDHRTFVIGVSADKPAAEVVSALGIGPRDRVLCCSASSSRALRAHDLAEITRTVSPASVIEAAGSVDDALRRATDPSSHPELVVVTGSLYVVAEARHWFRVSFPPLRIS